VTGSARAVHLDTHIVAWLYRADQHRLPLHARQLIDRADVAISPAVELELTLLHEIERLADPADVMIRSLAESIGLSVSTTAFPTVVRRATSLPWTRDPFDRLICANAIVDDAVLITRDRLIRRHLDRAVWDESPD
jgi:PIN domain nuclease of toxin-antitoxin system